jgi:hypothetical protein
MKKTLIATLALMVGFSTVAWSAESSGADSDETHFSTSAELANRPWNAANIGALRALDKAAVVRFSNMIGGKKGTAWLGTEDGISGFTWADLAGDGKYELLMTVVTKCCGYLFICWQEAPGKLRVQSYQGAGYDLAQMIRDLNGDGKQELILYGHVDTDDRISTLPAPVAEWPQVYRLQNGRYVEASREFPRFYDSEILPELEKGMSEARQDVAAQHGKPKPTPGPQFIQQKGDWPLPPRALAAGVMERDKILRVLGRDPEAGLSQAWEWVKSDDPYLVQDAVDTLEDIGGHEQELNAAKTTLKNVEQHALSADLR